MVSGVMALFLLLFAVIAIVVLTGKYKINAFLVLIGVSFVFGLLIGLPALDVVAGIKNGFGALGLIRCAG